MIEYLFEATVYAGSSTRTLYFTSGDQAVVVAGNRYIPRITNPGSLRIMMFGEGTTMGASKIGYGEVKFCNTDGGLDALIDCGFSGRLGVIKELIAGVTIGMTLSCSMEQPVFNNEEMSIRIKDPQLALKVPLQANKYAGTNVLPAGVEGTADIKGKPKPLLYGQVSNATPVCVNTSKLIYQGHDGALSAIANVYDKGVALTVGAAYGSQADMEANAPAAGQYRVWLAGGMFRLGSSPVGQVTFDATQGADAAARTAAQIAKLIALRVLTAGDLVAQDFTDLDALNSAVIGIYIDKETTVAAALDEVLGSVGGWYGFDSANKLNVGRLDAPSGAPAFSLDASQIIGLERLATEDEGRGLPGWKVNLGYDKNYTVQDKSVLAGSLHVAPWAATTLPASGNWNSIAYGNGLFVAIARTGGTAACATSPDGITWTQRAMPAADWTGVTYGNGLFVAVASGGSIAATSTDGITWTQRSLPSTSNWWSVTYGNGLFVAVSASFDTKAATSPDGITWTARTMPTTANWYGVAYGNGVFVATSASGGTAAASSADGITWTARTLPANGDWYGLAYGNGVFVTLAASSVNAYAATSPDGVTWTQRTLPIAAGWHGVAYGDGFFVAIGGGAGALTQSMKSADGVNWEKLLLPASANWNSVVFGNGTFAAVSQGSTLASIYRIAAESVRVQYLAKEYRTVTAEDATVKTAHLLATELNLNTLLVSAADAQTEATRQLNLRKPRRDYLAVTIKRSALAAIPDLGKVGRVSYPRFGMTGGKLFVLIGFNMELETDDLTLYLWG